MSIEVATEGLFLPTRPDFADFKVPVEDSFGWGNILEYYEVPTNEQVALFAFRSKLKQNANLELLDQLDQEALLAAQGAEGFMHYQPFVGLSYCLWRTHQNARNGLQNEAHENAVKIAPLVYDPFMLLSWKISRTALPKQVAFERFSLAA